MMAMFLGEETFKQGVRNYLKSLAYQNAEQDDLWSSLTNQAHKDKKIEPKLTVKDIMDTWTLQTGFPVVTVTRDCSQNKMKIVQQRYWNEGFEDEEEEYCWWVPISYTFGDNPNFNETEPTVWLSCPNKVDIELKVNNCKSWVIVNLQASGMLV